MLATEYYFALMRLRYPLSAARYMGAPHVARPKMSGQLVTVTLGTGAFTSVSTFPIQADKIVQHNPSLSQGLATPHYRWARADGFWRFL